jgi:hypothetical protein
MVSFGQSLSVLLEQNQSISYIKRNSYKRILFTHPFISSKIRLKSSADLNGMVIFPLPFAATLTSTLFPK